MQGSTGHFGSPREDHAIPGERSGRFAGRVSALACAVPFGEGCCNHRSVCRRICCSNKFLGPTQPRLCLRSHSQMHSFSFFQSMLGKTQFISHSHRSPKLCSPHTFGPYIARESLIRQPHKTHLLFLLLLPAISHVT